MMPGSLYLGHLGPIPLYAHWSALFLVGMAWFWTGGSTDPVFLVSFILVLLASIVLHELGHGMASRAIARNEAERTVTITLWAFGGVCMSFGSHQPWPRLFVVLAGPAVSLLLWCVGGIAISLAATGGVEASAAAMWSPETYIGAMASSVGLTTALLLYLVAQLNFLLLIFNMLPIYPFDGGQALYNLCKLGLRDYHLARSVTMGISVAAAIGYFSWRTITDGQPSLFLGMILAWALMNAWTSLRNGA